MQRKLPLLDVCQRPSAIFRRYYKRPFSVSLHGSRIERRVTERMSLSNTAINDLAAKSSLNVRPIDRENKIVILPAKKSEIFLNVCFVDASFHLGNPIDLN